MKYVVLAVLALVGFGATAEARDPSLYNHNPNEVKIWMARVLVAEQGNTVTKDAYIIPCLLRKNWDKRGTKDFVSYIRQYSRPMSKIRANHSPRAKRIQNMLWFDIPKPIRQVVLDWMDGKFKNPCPQATDWDMSSAEVSEHMVRVDCGNTANNFYKYVKNP